MYMSVVVDHLPISATVDHLMYVSPLIRATQADEQLVWAGRTEVAKEVGLRSRTLLLR
jgi:hypothetical protein